MKKLFVLISLLLNINYSWALRCNGSLVYDGDSQAMVVNKCGSPQAKRILSTTQPLFNSSGAIYGSVPFLTEVWTYQASPETFIYKVYFTDKKVTSITSKVPYP